MDTLSKIFTKTFHLCLLPDIIDTTTKGHPMAIRILDGNAFSVIAAGRRELREQGREDQIPEFTADMTSSDSYDKLLQTFLKWFPNEKMELS